MSILPSINQTDSGALTTPIPCGVESKSPSLCRERVRNGLPDRKTDSNNRDIAKERAEAASAAGKKSTQIASRKKSGAAVASRHRRDALSVQPEHTKPSCSIQNFSLGIQTKAEPKPVQSCASLDQPISIGSDPSLLADRSLQPTSYYCNKLLPELRHWVFGLESTYGNNNASDTAPLIDNRSHDLYKNSRRQIDLRSIRSPPRSIWTHPRSGLNRYRKPAPDTTRNRPRTEPPNHIAESPGLWMFDDVDCDQAIEMVGKNEL